MSFFKFKIVCLLVCLCSQAGLAGATAIYRSVGPGQTAALASGGANGLSLFGSTASFAIDLPDNIGVGDVIQYDADNNGVAEELAFIINRNNGGSYTVQNASGGTPPMTQGGTGDQDWAIYRAYTSMANAETGSENTGILAGLRNFDTWSGGQDLTSNGDSWHVACYADNVDTTPVAWDGWTTSSSDYIRIFTPYQTSEVGTSQRHSGVWNTSAYRLEVSNSTALETSASYMRIEGLQLRVSSVSGSGQRGVRLDSQVGTADFRVSHCLIRGTTTGQNNHNGIDVNNSGSGEVKFWNNIIYDFNVGSGIRCNDSGFTNYVYNNTLFNCGVGYDRDNGTMVLKNNIAQDCSDGYNGTFHVDSDYNLSDLASDAPGTNSRNAQPVIFESEASDNFHLGSTDDGAKAMGLDLSGDFDWPINDDIDNEARSGAWDIGADEYPLATMIFRSVGPGNTAPLDTGSGNEMIITGDSAVFTLALPDNVGIGDALQYDSDNNGSVDAVVFVTERKSATNLIVKTATGGNPSGTAADEDWSIYRSYTSLSNAENGSENTGINAGLRNFDTWSGGRNMVLNNEIWTIACYNDGVDTTPVFWDGWTTGLENYVSIMTATSFLEAGTSQRHQGTWTTSGYRLSVSNNTAIQIQDNYVHLEGLQIQVASVNASIQKAIAITAYSGTGQHDISYNIIRGVANAAYDWHNAISVWNSDLGTVRIWNNMIYDFNSVTSTNVGGIELNDVQYTVYAYNNTIHNCRIGVWQRAGNFVVKNMVVQDCVDGYEAVTIFDAASTNNVSDLPLDAPGSSALNSTTILFVDEASDNFHLSDLDNQARNTGVDLQSDSGLAFSDDINQQLRSIWDRGADENSNPLLTPTNTITLTTTVSPTISATLTASPTISPTNTLTPTRTATPTPTHTPPETPTISPTVTVTPTTTPTSSITTTSTVSPTSTITLTLSPTATVTPTTTITPEMELPDDLSQALVYPNPYRREVKPQEEISFYNLPRVATIKIYTINGQVVKVIEKNSPFPWERWNLKNEQGGKIASGIYIYIVKAGQAEKKGKFAIIK